MWGQTPGAGVEMVTFLTFLARCGACGGTSRRMPIGALMSGFEKPPRGRRLCPRRRTVDRAAVVSMSEIWYTTLCKKERSLRYVYNGNTKGGMQEKACTNRPRQNAGRVARFYPQAMCYAQWCKGLSGVCWSPALSQRETDRYPDVSHDASTHRIGFWFSWMLPRCGGCCVACRWRVLDFKRKRLRLAGKWHLFLGRRPCTSLGVGCEEICGDRLWERVLK